MTLADGDFESRFRFRVDVPISALSSAILTVLSFVLCGLLSATFVFALVEVAVPVELLFLSFSSR